MKQRWGMRISVMGRSLTVREWAEVLRVSRHFIYDRMKKGMTPEQAVSLPRAVRHKGLVVRRGIALPLGTWARRRGIDGGTLHYRVVRAGWPLEKALTKPVQRWNRLPVDAVAQAACNGISPATFYKRIEHGWDLERAMTKPVGPYSPKKKRREEDRR